MSAQMAFAQDTTDADDDTDDEGYEDPSQPEIDSLLSLITPQTPDSTKARYYRRIAYISSSVDTTMKYAFLSLDFCSQHDTVWIAENNRFVAWGYYMKDETQKGVPYMLKSSELFLQINDSCNLTHNYKNLSQFYAYLNKQDSASYYINRALEINVKRSDTAEIAECYKSMGKRYEDLGLFTEAEKYFTKAFYLDSLDGNLLECAFDYFRLGELYDLQQELYKARFFLKKSINLFDSINSDADFYVYSKFAASGTLAFVYIKLAKQTQEKKYADSCLFYYKTASDYYLKNGLISNYLDDTASYLYYLFFYKKYKEALSFLLSIKHYYNDATPNLTIALYHSRLKEVYLHLGDFKNAYENLVKEKEYESAYINDSSLTALADMKTEQAMMMEKLNREQMEQEHENKQKRLMIVIISLSVISVLIFLIFWHKRTANKQLAAKNEMLSQQKSEIESQRDEIEAQKNIITEQWHEVEEVNQKLFSSINYAERIQRAAVSAIEDVKALFPDSFVYYKPRDIVSGDYYRCAKCGRFSVMITADCTGHGIPGAFLSMLGLSGLKEFMVSESDAENPGTVLDRMRTFIKSTLGAPKGKHSLDDGMDMTICCFDFENMELRYAIANQKIIYIRGGEVQRLKGDNMPVGRYVREREHFESFTMKIQKGDMFYMFSDGIEDQLGGDSADGMGRKFLVRNLEAFLLEISPEPAETQCELLDNKILAWRGGTPQIDDMTMVGIRV